MEKIDWKKKRRLNSPTKWKQKHFRFADKFFTMHIIESHQNVLDIDKLMIGEFNAETNIAAIAMAQQSKYETVKLS